MLLFSGARSVFLAAALGLLVCAAQAQQRTLRIPRVARPPTLEDFLNGTPREAEAHITGFRQRRPGDGAPASRETAAYLSYDDKNLYVVFVCKDEPGKVRARMSKREDISGDDVLAVYLDTFRDRQRAYYFLANPLGIQLDGIATEGQGDDNSFDTLWYSEGRLTPEGFVVWMRIPFKSLRFANSTGQTWGIALARSIVRSNEESWWPYITERVEGFAQQFATLEGLERISPGRNVQLIPFASFARARFLEPGAAGGPAFATDTDGRVGLDAKIVLKDALTLDVALNPDFSQVESDEPQVTVNQRFEVFFPEKRPFFIENAGFFQTPEQLFFSRRIVDPQFGARLTGKVGRWALGALAADDRAPGRLVAESDPRYGRRAVIGMARMQREFGRQSNIGLLVTSRDFASSSNRVLAFDTRLKLNPNWVLSGQAMRSYTRELNGTRLSGPAYLVNLSHFGRHFGYTTQYLDRSPDFRSRLGFIPRQDIRQVHHFVNYDWRPEGRRVLSFGPHAIVLTNWDRQGRVQDSFAVAGFSVVFTGQTGVHLRRSESYELFQGRGFRKHYTTIAFSSARLKWLEVSAHYSPGTRINFFPGAGLAPFLAHSREGTIGLTLRPTPRFRFQQTYIYNRLGTRARSLPPGVPAGAAIFNNHLLRWKLNYQFSRELSLRAILDYNAVLPDPSLVALERQKRITGDILFTYLVNPGTALYIGYTDRRENLALGPGAPPTLRRIGSPDTSTGRQFFVKMSYLFRF